MKKHMLAVLLFTLIFSSFENGHCVTLKNSGYDITIDWEQQQNTLKVWGKLQGGKECQQINLEVYLRHPGNKEISVVVAMIPDYDGSEATWEGKDPVWIDKKLSGSGEWYVNQVSARCLQ